LDELNGQNFRFERLNEQNGLPQANVKAINQGPQGYLWVGTDFGILRYDGNVFESMLSEKGIPIEVSIISIHHNLTFIGAISETKLYLFKSNGINTTELAFPKNTIIKPTKIILYSTGLLIAAENGLWRYSFENKQFLNLHKGSPVTDITLINSSKIVYSNVEGLYAFYPFNETIVPLNYQPISFIKHINFDGENELSWIEADNYFHAATLTKNSLKITKNIALSTTEGSTALNKYRGYYLLGTSEGILSFNDKGKETIFRQIEGDFQSLSNNRINAQFIDNTGNLWVGTRLGGLNLYNPYRHKFELISPTLNANYSKFKEILSLAETKNGDIIFQGALKGLGVFNPLDKKLTKWVQTDLIGNCIIPEEDVNSFLIGTPQGLYQFNLETEKLSFISTKNKIKNFEGDIKSIVPLGNSQYWFAGRDGLFLFDLKTKQTISFYGIGNSNIGSEDIRYIQQFSSKELFVCTKMGLYIFDIEKQNFKLIKLSKGLKEPMISCVIKDKNENIWIGTAGQGIFILNSKKELNYSINTENGLANNTIYALNMDKEKTNCWASSNQGLSSINIESKIVNNFHLQDDIQGSEFMEGATLLSNAGYLYFGGIAGINFFNPNLLASDTNDCKIIIKSISAFNNVLPYAPYYKIPISQNYISFDYAALDFNINSNHNYYYMMEGLQNTWTDAGNRRFASFGQLPQGEYTFMVKVKNPDGKMSKYIASLAFRIEPPFYQTLWFKILTILFVAGLGALLIYNNTKKAISEEQEMSRQSKIIAELELKALRAQMNPHFIFNSLNSIQDYVLNNEGNLAARYLSKFAKLMRMIMDISEQTFVNIEAKITFLKLYVELESLRLNNSLEVTFKIDPDIDLDSLIPTLLIQPHIENAIWHGLQYKESNKKLHIQFNKIGENFLEVIVEDNGIGRAEAISIKNNKTIHHVSKGSKNSEDRIQTLIKLFGSKPKIEIIDLFNEKNIACGTKVILQIPMIHG
jgi:ligand-binding sensor domain-containing protein